MIYLAAALLTLASCDEVEELIGENDPMNVVVKNDGSTSNGSIFSAIDDKNFYIDYIKYSVVDGHLAVTGFDDACNDNYLESPRLLSRLTVKGSSYELLEIKDMNNCSALKSIVLPDVTTRIGDRAFNDCNMLKRVYLGKGVKTISKNAFSGSPALQAIEAHKDNSNFASKDGVLLNKDCSELIACPRALSGTYSVPQGVNSIAENAFSGCTLLRTISLPETLKEVDAFAFRNCSGLTEITLPENISSIGSYAFTGCSSLNSVAIRATVPPSISSDSFSFKETLHVRSGCKEAYENDVYWSRFKEIVDDLK